MKYVGIKYNSFVVIVIKNEIAITIHIQVICQLSALINH